MAFCALNMEPASGKAADEDKVPSLLANAPDLAERALPRNDFDLAALLSRAARGEDVRAAIGELLRLRLD